MKLPQSPSFAVTSHFALSTLFVSHILFPTTLGAQVKLGGRRVSTSNT